MMLNNTNVAFFFDLWCLFFKEIYYLCKKIKRRLYYNKPYRSTVKRRNMKQKGMITQFIDYLVNNRGYSVNTAAAYSKALHDFARYARGIDCRIRWSSITKGFIDSYVVSLQNRQAARKSIKMHVSALRSFFAWMRGQGLTDLNPARFVSTPKLADTLPAIVEPAIIEKAISGAGPLAAAIIATLYDTGIRLGELISLDTRNVDKKLRAIKITGKGNRERIVFYRERTARLLNRYAEGKRGQIFSGLSAEDVRFMVYREFDRYGVNVSPHQLRHSFATGLLRHGVSLEAARQILGHKSITTTQRYLHLGMPWILDEYNKITAN